MRHLRAIAVVPDPVPAVIRVYDVAVGSRTIVMVLLPGVLSGCSSAAAPAAATRISQGVAYCSCGGSAVAPSPTTATAAAGPRPSTASSPPAAYATGFQDFFYPRVTNKAASQVNTSR
ncbi:hypothetical protein Vafri_4962 [Volvox africanus]|uniref:Uncharacterized protein n=1 Tax=Volvox africanus TaxID=51714 RepID=A0A8J4AXI1_9CHLO|nr:hypothetical protein Vafri_4962 [Volvox africanus]